MRTSIAQSVQLTRTQRNTQSLGVIAAPPTLQAAWRRVRANKGGPGGDGVTYQMFERHLDRELTMLSRRLLDGSYRPRRLRRFEIAKPLGGIRRLAIPAIVDRVAQTAAMLALGPDLDARFSASSHGYRPGHGVANAVAELQGAIASGRDTIVDLDIEAYFDSIPHRRLLQELAIWIEDDAVLRLMALWLRGFSRFGRGVAQGAPISPLLSNLYLHPLDRLLSSAGFTPIRYADDMIIPCATENQAHAALRLVQSLLGSRGLRLNRTKSRILTPGESFVFLGAPFGHGRRSALGL